MSYGRTPEQHRRWVSVKAAVLVEQYGCCGFPRTDEPSINHHWGELHPHHIWPRGKGGPDEEWNVVWLCAGHHRWVHEHPLRAQSYDLLRKGPPEPNRD